MPIEHIKKGVEKRESLKCSRHCSTADASHLAVPKESKAGLPEDNLECDLAAASCGKIGF